MVDRTTAIEAIADQQHMFDALAQYPLSLAFTQLPFGKA